MTSLPWNYILLTAQNIGDSERLSPLPKATQLGSGRTKFLPKPESDFGANVLFAALHYTWNGIRLGFPTPHLSPLMHCSEP